MNLGIFTKPLMRNDKSFMYLTQKLSISWTKQAFWGLFILLLLMCSHKSFSQVDCPWVALQDKLVLIGGDPPKKMPELKVSAIPAVKDVIIPVNGSSDGVEWEWQDMSDIKNLLTNYKGLNTQFKFSNGKFSPDSLDRIYQFTYRVVGKKTGCPDAKSEIKIKILPGIHPYNVMTPNSDSFNDVWMIENITGTEIYPGVIIKIFDRWGQEVFASKGNKPQFDALVNPSKLPTGTYVYSIKPEEDYPEVMGELTIIR